MASCLVTAEMRAQQPPLPPPKTIELASTNAPNHNSAEGSLQKPQATSQALWGASASLIMLAGASHSLKKPNRNAFCRAVAHPFSWVGWGIDSVAATATLLSSGAWGLSLFRGTSAVLNLLGAHFALQDKQSTSKSAVTALWEFLRDPKERSNAACLITSVAATIALVGIKVSGVPLEGRILHTISSLALGAYLASSLPSLFQCAKELLTPLPRCNSFHIKEFCKNNTAAISWPLSSVVAIPAAFYGQQGWAAWSWAVLPVVVNSALFINAWRAHVREIGLRKEVS